MPTLRAVQVAKESQQKFCRTRITCAAAWTQPGGCAYHEHRARRLPLLELASMSREKPMAASLAEADQLSFPPRARTESQVGHLETIQSRNRRSDSRYESSAFTLEFIGSAFSRPRSWKLSRVRRH